MVTLNRSQSSLAAEASAKHDRLRQEVNAERDRRIAAGFSHEGHLYQFRDQDKARISGAGSLAGFAVASGAQAGNLRWHGGAEDFTWIDADNNPVLLDAQQMFALAQAAATHETAHVFAAKALKDLPTIPADFANDANWPQI